MRTGYLRSSINHPFAAGVVAVLLIASLIFIVGDSQTESSVVRSVNVEHRADLTRFAAALHHSGLPLSGADAPGSLAAIADTGTFDMAVQRALFGLRAARLDLYTLDGQPLYSTSPGVAPTLSGHATDAFTAALNGGTPSLLRSPSSSSQTGHGSDARILQSFTVIRDVPPDSVDTGRALMVAAISTDVSGEISSAYNTIWLVAGVFTIGSFLILTAVHWAYVRSRRRLQAANDALAAQNEAVRESRERMIAASDMTKRAIAEELHGTVQTKLFSLWLRLSQVKTKLDRGDGADMLELGAVIAELDSVRENDIRGLSHRLHPSIVRVGAAPALKSLCGGLSGAVKIELKIDPAAARLEPLGASQIPEDIRLAAYRIAEMAIGNTIKHASASKCTVTWSYSRSKSRLELTVEDDGAGFDPASRAPSGLGIVNIQDYTDALGGEVSLESRPGHGTTLRAHIPFIAPPTPLQTPAQTFGKRSQSGPDEMARAA